MNERDLEALLSAPEPYIEDAGFTARVTARLPAAGARRRRLTVLAATVLAALVGFVLLPGGAALTATLRSLAAALASAPSDPAAALRSLGPQSLAVAAVVLVMIVWGAWSVARATED